MAGGIPKRLLFFLYLPPGLELLSTLSGSNYPCLEQIPIVPKMFEPLKFDCIVFIHDNYTSSNMDRTKFLNVNDVTDRIKLKICLTLLSLSF